MASLSQPSWVDADGGGISLSICPNLELMKLGSMLEKLLLAFTITFCLNLFWEPAKMSPLPQLDSNWPKRQSH